MRRGTVHALIGPNGSGKTTLLNVVTGLYRATAGRIVARRRDVTALPAAPAHRAGLARTFQNIRLFRSMTVLENVMIGAERRGQHAGRGRPRRRWRRARRPRSTSSASAVARAMTLVRASPTAISG